MQAPSIQQEPGTDTIAPDHPSVLDATLAAYAGLDDSPDRGSGNVLTHAAELLLLSAFALVPLAAVAYLLVYQDPALRIVSHGVHEVAIAIAILEGGFITYVTWRCYLTTGEPFLRWLTLSFLAFSLLYAPHGFFTPLAHEHAWTFLIYGPASRLAMAIFLLAGLFQYGMPAHALSRRRSLAFWGGWTLAFLVVDLLLGWLSLALPETMPILRLAMEYGALALAVIGIVIMLASRPASPLMLLYALSLAFFAQSSLAFVIASPWDHLWWLAHAISAGGFLLLGYGVLRAFHSTRSFSLVFSQQEVFDYLRAARASADRSARQLQIANEELAHLAATDPLTGIANRRHFIDRVEAELARAARSGEPLALIALDLDHFKQINDRLGHEIGDLVLKRVCTVANKGLRPSDLLGRLGGEEFCIMLPGTDLAAATAIAERLRASIEAGVVDSAAGLPYVTASIGIACTANDGTTLEALLRTADARLYQAKHRGRNTVVAIGDTAIDAPSDIDA